MTNSTTSFRVQLYSGNYLDDTKKGKGGVSYHKHAGLCLGKTGNQASPPHSQNVLWKVCVVTSENRYGTVEYLLTGKIVDTLTTHCSVLGLTQNFNQEQTNLKPPQTVRDPLQTVLV